MRIRDLGNAEIGPIDERIISRFNGKSSLNIGVIKQAVANPLELSNAVRAEVDKINPGLPPDMKLIVSYDTSVFIDRSISNVFETIGEAMLLVVLVIFFFLRSLRATLIPIVTIPVSLIGAFALMYVMGFTINTLTLLSMVLAIGLVVDDAIVMLENIFRHIEEGVPRRAAAIQGAREIGFAIVAMTLTLASVFAPLAFATGRTGRLFIEFALTLAGAVLVSGFIALTLSPMMCSLLLRHQEKHSWIYNLIEGWIEALTGGYRRALGWTLHHRWIVVGAWFAVLGTGALLFTQLKSELAPSEDRGVVFGLVTAPQGSTPQYTADLHQADRAHVRADTRGRRVRDDPGFPDRRRRQRRAAAETLGGEAQEAAADHRRAPAPDAADPRRDCVSDQSAVARPVVPVDADRIRDHVADSLCRTAAHRRPIPG